MLAKLSTIGRKKICREMAARRTNANVRIPERTVEGLLPTFDDNL
jgi:hypothetical protein